MVKDKLNVNTKGLLDIFWTKKLIPSKKTLQENQKLKMEFEMLRMENESLKLEVAKYVSASQKRRGDGHDSGDFNTFGETSVDAEGRVTGLLGSLQVPFLLTQEIETREERMKTYFRNKISELKIEREELKSKTEHYVKEVSVCLILNCIANGIEFEIACLTDVLLFQMFLCVYYALVIKVRPN